jgi:hypothetical protein
MKKKKPPKIRHPIIYDKAAEPIEYVGKYTHELKPEIARLLETIQEAKALLDRLSRFRHIAITTAKFQLANTSSDPDLAIEALPKEIARLNYLMEDSLGLLNILCDSKLHWLEQARFKLTFGQTPRKREMVGQKDKHTYEPDDAWAHQD